MAKTLFGALWGAPYNALFGQLRRHFQGFVGFMLVWFVEVGGGKSLFSRYLRVTGGWRKLLASFSTNLDPNPTSWCRAMAVLS